MLDVDPTSPTYGREISRMELGSRPARRAATPSLEGLRAIPWVFAWSQGRTNLPAWYGVGTALATYAQRHPDGRRDLAEAYRRWSFFGSLVDNVELGLAIADPALAARYSQLAGDDPAMRRIATTVEDERRRTVEQLTRLTGHERLLEGSPRLRRSIDLRTPYVDVLSESVNNPLRLLLGWFVVTPDVVPPVSLLVAYWMVGAFFMASKRFAEYRSIGDPIEQAALHLRQLTDGNHIEIQRVDQQIDDDHRGRAESQRQRQVTAGVPHFLGHVRRGVPSGEAEHDEDEGGAERGEKLHPREIETQ